MTTISKDLLFYLEQLSTHNEREWFHDGENQAWYKAKRQEFINFVEAFRDGVAERCEPKLAGLESKQMLFRINRDVRFSNDKSPYKTNFGAALSKEGGKKSPYAGRYLHIQPGNHSFVCGGLYSPPKETIEVVRDKMERDGKKFDALVADKKFVQNFEAVSGRELKTHPRNRSANTASLHRVRKKEWYALREFKDSDVVKESFLEQCLNTAVSLTEMNNFLNDAIEDLFV